MVVTRAREQSGQLVSRLAAMGAEVLVLPLVEFREPEDTAPVDTALNTLREFDWILFTSQNAVRFFALRARTLGVTVNARPASRIKFGAVGPATADAAQAAGFPVEHTAADSRGAGLARELANLLEGKRVLLPRGDRAGRELPEALRKAGALVTEVIAYRNCAADSVDEASLRRISEGNVDAIALASPSAVQGLQDVIGDRDLTALSERMCFAAIGPTTAAAMRSAGLKVGAEAERPSADGLCKAITRALNGPTKAKTVKS